MRDANNGLVHGMRHSAPSTEHLRETSASFDTGSTGFFSTDTRSPISDSDGKCLRLKKHHAVRRKFKLVFATNRTRRTHSRAYKGRVDVAAGLDHCDEVVCTHSGAIWNRVSAGRFAAREQQSYP
jgi:hypothetical protein